MQSSRPLLVIVSGAPAAGKTTVATRLARDLRVPLLAKDELKEALGDALGAPRDVAASQRLGRAAYAALFATARRILESGIGLVLESNFRRGGSEAELAPLVAAADARLVHCTARPALLRARYERRFTSGRRHPVHLDGERAMALGEDLEAGRFEPLELPIPRLVVDTSDGMTPGHEEQLQFVRRAPGRR
ncbi:MAG TPA: AAA family ATPase [Candidatus Limnocylindria bacterium]|nr:AAA family ATPase [Candidatus Limnocylindria bacterium]